MHITELAEIKWSSDGQIKKSNFHFLEIEFSKMFHLIKNVNCTFKMPKVDTIYDVLFGIIRKAFFTFFSCSNSPNKFQEFKDSIIRG
jgi:hypothetical protein